MALHGGPRQGIPWGVGVEARRITAPTALGIGREVSWGVHHDATLVKAGAYSGPAAPPRSDERYATHLAKIGRMVDPKNPQKR